MNNHYLFNNSYFDGLEGFDINEQKGLEEMIKRFEETVERTKDSVGNEPRKNEIIRNYTFSGKARIKPDGAKSFELRTAYPGMLLGLGYAHQAFSSTESIKTGFSFDYVSGEPYIPSTTVKGVLRSAFAHPEHIGAILAELGILSSDSINDFNSKVCKELARKIFGPEPKADEETKARYTSPFERDVFFDGVITSGAGSSGKVLDLDYITPHVDYSLNAALRTDAEKRSINSPAEKKRGLTSPKPIRMLKVIPGVSFRFDFLVRKNVTVKAGATEVVISPDARVELYKRIFLDLGIGAKTNVGFGVLEEVSKNG